MNPLYVVAFPELSSDDASRIEAIRAEHDPFGHALLKAHFTFVFGCTGIPAQVVESAMVSAANAVGPIAFCLSSVVLETHGEFHYVFLFPDEGSEEMLALHRRLHEGALAATLDPGRTFAPHMTLCKTSDRKQAEQLMRELQRGAIRIAGKLTALTLGELAAGRFHRLSDSELVGGARD